MPVRPFSSGLLALVLAFAVLPGARAAAGSTPPPSLLPTHRLVVYYGNPLTPLMGVLGQTPTSAMLARLDAQAAAYQRLDPSHPVVRALEMVTVVAQGQPGPDGLYRTRMPPALVARELALARAHGDLLILDLQVGRSSVPAEVTALTPFLLQPDVELALDPEFDMSAGGVPGQRFGTMSAQDVEWTLRYLSNLVLHHHLPQKVLIVHQFLDSMIPDWQAIQPVPGVAFVKDMDGFGGAAVKVEKYERYIRDQANACTLPPEPTAQDRAGLVHPAVFLRTHELAAVPVCGAIKLFYTQDVPVLTPSQVLSELTPAPLVVIYQ